jgi:nifR3 family TIM-barrel protein
MSPERAPLAVGSVALDAPLVMAPMANVTDVHFHEVLRELGGPGLYTAEMVPSKALARGCKRGKRMLARPRGCEAFAIQIYGAVPEDLAASAAEAADAGADIVDINMGCPAKKITGKACGSSLLRDLPLVGEIFRAVRSALPDAVPLTVKTRTGWDDDEPAFLDVLRVAEDEGLAAMTLHGRSRKQMYRGESDWGAIAELKKAAGIPIFGNGDVTSPQHALDMLELTGCDAVMIARGALANPWIFQQARALLAGRPVEAPSLDDRRRVILDHHDRMAEALKPREVFGRIRKFAGFYLNGLERGADFRRRLSEPSNAAEFRALVDGFFDELAAEFQAA